MHIDPVDRINGATSTTNQMQAILTRYYGPTNTKGSSIKASCERGSILVPYPHECNEGHDAHRFAAQALLDKFVAEDRKNYGPDSKPAWGRPFVSGGLPNGDWAHVFLPQE